jgi:hypothetical protein
MNARSARHRLLDYFNRNGYVRSPDLKIRKTIGTDKYKKGWEIRLVAKTKDELYLIGELLDEVGLKKGEPFKKGKLTVQPVYGKQAVEWFKTRE